MVKKYHPTEKDKQQDLDAEIRYANTMDYS